MLPLLLTLAIRLGAQTPGTGTHFHHVHLNSTDPAAAIRFYTTRFHAEAKPLGGEQAVFAQERWLLFQKVKQAPPALDTDSPVWHIGWGAEDMRATYEKQVAAGTKFHTPITDISDLANFKGFYYAYVDGPDHALIELNTARHHDFGHLHLFSNDPHAAADWYAKYLGVKPRKSAPGVRMYREVQVGPSASFTIDNVNVIVYPAGYRKHNRFRSSRGTVFDHVAFTVPDLKQTLAAMQRDGIRVLQKPKRMGKTGMRSAIVEGPDQLAIEIVQ